MNTHQISVCLFQKDTMRCILMKVENRMLFMVIFLSIPFCFHRPTYGNDIQKKIDVSNLKDSGKKTFGFRFDNGDMLNRTKDIERNLYNMVYNSPKNV